MLLDWSQYVIRGGMPVSRLGHVCNNEGLATLTKVPARSYHSGTVVSNVCVWDEQSSTWYEYTCDILTRLEDELTCHSSPLFRGA